MAELVDALDSKSSSSNTVWVRFPLRVLKAIEKPLSSKDYKGCLFDEYLLNASKDHGSSGNVVEQILNTGFFIFQRGALRR